MSNGTKNIQLPNGSIVAFPDTMPDNAISSVIQRNFPELRGGALAAHEPTVPPKKSAMQSIGSDFANIYNAPYKRNAQVQEEYKDNPAARILGTINSGVQLGLAQTPIPYMENLIRRIPSPGNLYGVGNAAMDAVMALPQLISEIGKGTTGLALDQFRDLGTTPEKAKQIKQEAGETGGTAAQFLAPVVSKYAGSKLSTGASKMAGKAFGAGENFMRTEQLGKFAQENRITLNRTGFKNAGDMANSLNNDINTKIIEPATEAGAVINGDKYVNSMGEYLQELQKRAVPDRAAILAVKRMIEEAQKRLSESPEPGVLTPAVAQEMKVTNNKILSDVYDKLAAGGNITERGAARKAALMTQTDQLRRELEGLHPELRRVNWYEGQSLELKNAIYDYLNRTARGEGGGRVVARGGMGQIPRLSVYDLLHVRPIASRLAIVLGSIGRAMSGKSPDLAKGVENPFSASKFSPPDATATTPTKVPVVPESPFSTNQSQKIGQNFTTNEAVQSFKNYENSTPEQVKTNQHSAFREQAEAFVEKMFAGVDKKGANNSYTPQELNARLQWLQGGKSPKDFPTPRKMVEPIVEPKVEPKIKSAPEQLKEAASVKGDPNERISIKRKSDGKVGTVTRKNFNPDKHELI